MTTINDNVSVTGGFSAGNWIFGTDYITPTAGSPSSTEIRGINAAGTGEFAIGQGGIAVFACARSRAPWDPWIKEVTVNNVDSSADQFDVVMYRGNGTNTEIHWMYIREP